MRSLGLRNGIIGAALVVVAGVGVTAAVVHKSAPGHCRDLKPTSVTTDSAGARTYTYSNRGQTFSQVVPPEGWSPATATDAELQNYGFPPRPKNPDALASWRKMVGSQSAAAQPGMCVRDGVRKG